LLGSIDARWGFSHTKDIWLQSTYDISSTGPTIVPLSADFTTANVQDNHMYNPLISSTLFPETRYMVRGSGYDYHKLYDLCTKRGFQLMTCPVQRYKNTRNSRLELIEFYESELGQALCPTLNYLEYCIAMLCVLGIIISLNVL
jgi:hypothetical protein